MLQEQPFLRMFVFITAIFLLTNLYKDQMAVFLKDRNHNQKYIDYKNDSLK